MRKERTPETTYKIMSSIPSKATKPEILLRKALWHENLRYRVNYKKVPGKPDVAFTKYKVAVFCDGDFWHGHNWAIRGLGSLSNEMENYSEYWQEKIHRNVEHDEVVNKELQAMGWKVVRLWESDINSKLDECVRVVKEALFESMIQDGEHEELSVEDINCGN